MLKIVVEEHVSKEREKAISQVAESVTELADIFKEIQVPVIDQGTVISPHLPMSPHISPYLQVLVIDQGTVLDRIDFNIEQAADLISPHTPPYLPVSPHILSRRRTSYLPISPPISPYLPISRAGGGPRAERRRRAQQGQRVPEEVEDDDVHLPAAAAVRCAAPPPPPPPPATPGPRCVMGGACTL